MEMTLTSEQFEELVTKPCTYCGADISDVTGRGLDRLDRFRGYTPDNVVPCCWTCNHVKGTTFNEHEMKVLASHFDEFRQRRRELNQPELCPPKAHSPRTPKHWASEGKRNGWKYLHKNQA